ncbi:MAG: methyltransferase domain-containing protein, partial [Gammaproteobacteria bacterium]|nr:methyltransferase domain-containing protein [Gammaproteobacteria bacterium]
MIVWQQSRGGCDYQIRTAGNSVRLYRNGVFHSQYNGSRLLNGGVWDMLWLPLCFLPTQQVRRVLMLGVGSGAALKKIHDFYPQAKLTGVDIDGQHLRIAKRFTRLCSANIKLIEADAQAWLRTAQGFKFDIIIDDLFIEQGGEPSRAFAFDAKWLGLLRRRLAKNGLLVANCVAMAEARQLLQQPAAKTQRPGARPGFDQGYTLQQAGYANV